MKDLYSKEHRKVMQVNYDYSSMSANRIEEVVNFARGMGFKRIGIAHCITFYSEAEVLEKHLSKFFEVYTVDCKYGRLSKEELLGGSGRRILCNPAGQAAFLNENGCELNISMGLCVGHDMIFSKTSEGLVTNLFDKDFTNNNSPAAAIDSIR